MFFFKNSLIFVLLQNIMLQIEFDKIDNQFQNWWTLNHFCILFLHDQELSLQFNNPVIKLLISTRYVPEIANMWMHVICILCWSCMLLQMLHLLQRATPSCVVYMYYWQLEASCGVFLPYETIMRLYFLLANTVKSCIACKPRSTKCKASPTFKVNPIATFQYIQNTGWRVGFPSLANLLLEYHITQYTHTL